MSETVLKREFKEKDVQRVRNIITKKHGEKDTVQAGYETERVVHKEGDVWEDEHGKTWTIQDGIKQNIDKQSEFKKIGELPLVCPECKEHMKSNSLNKKMYLVHEMCGDCVIKMETKLKLVGKYEEYQSAIMSGNRREFLDDLAKTIDSWAEEKEESYMAENGDLENWVGGQDKKKIAEGLKKDIEELKSKNI